MKLAGLGPLSTYKCCSEGTASDDDGANRLQPPRKYPSSTSSESSRIRGTSIVLSWYPTLKTLWCAGVATGQRGFRRRVRINGTLSEVSRCFASRQVLSRVCRDYERVGEGETLTEVIARTFNLVSAERTRFFRSAVCPAVELVIACRLPSVSRQSQISRMTTFDSWWESAAVVL